MPFVNNAINSFLICGGNEKINNYSLEFRTQTIKREHHDRYDICIRCPRKFDTRRDSYYVIFCLNVFYEKEEWCSKCNMHHKNHLCTSALVYVCLGPTKKENDYINKLMVCFNRWKFCLCGKRGYKKWNFIFCNIKTF